MACDVSPVAMLSFWLQRRASDQPPAAWDQRQECARHQRHWGHQDDADIDDYDCNGADAHVISCRCWDWWLLKLFQICKKLQTAGPIVTVTTIPSDHFNSLIDWLVIKVGNWWSVNCPSPNLLVLMLLISTFLMISLVIKHCDIFCIIFWTIFKLSENISLKLILTKKE